MSELDRQALPDRELRRVRVLLILLFPVVLLGAWVAYALAITPIKAPLLEAAGLLATLVLLGGAVVMIWVALRVTWLLVRWLAPVDCPGCHGRARLRRLRHHGSANYIVLHCAGCGQTYENFLSWAANQS